MKLILLLLSIQILPVLSETKIKSIKKIEDLILNENYERALILLEKFSKKEFNYYFLKARIYQDKKNNTEALINYTIASQYKPNNYKIYNNRALVKGALDDFNGAISDLNKSIEINPNYAESYINRGVTYNVLNKPSIAIENFDSAIKLNPNMQAAYLNRAITNQYLGNKDKVCPDLIKARDFGNNDVQNWINILCND